jgi:hypothetical protein
MQEWLGGKLVNIQRLGSEGVALRIANVIGAEVSKEYVW